MGTIHKDRGALPSGQIPHCLPHLGCRVCSEKNGIIFPTIYASSMCVFGYMHVYVSIPCAASLLFPALMHVWASYPNYDSPGYQK